MFNAFKHILKPKFNYKYIYKLGEGANSNVYKVKSNETSNFYTCKRFKKYKKENALNEIKILKNIKTNNNCLPKYHKLIEYEKSLYLLTNYIDGIELFDKFYSKKKKKINEIEAKKNIHKMILCIEECNKNNIIHLDIKPENFIYSNNGKIKLIDFGCSQIFDNKNNIYCLNSKKIGTASYCSPEILYKNYYHINSDVWSLGVCIYGILTKKKIFNEFEINNPEKKFKELEIFTPELQDLLQKIFLTNPRNRIYLEDIKKHKWFDNL